MAVVLFLFAIFLRLGLLPCCIVVPLFKLSWVFDVGFEIRDCPAVWTQKVWPGGTIEDRSYAFVMPDVRTWCYKQ